MEQDVVISVKKITKSFKIYFDKGSTFKEKILFKKRNRFENHQVLNGISFDVKRGEAIGLIGQNGCGKSTTLKLLSKIMYPDSGSIEMKGRVSALIELGAGFHPDMTGRENIYTNAAIFGLTRKEIDERIQTIIDFSELGEFIDNPVRTYSSGMYMRLAFSVAINVDADILLIDEILAVGDAAFQAKCFNKMREIKAQGTTIVLVSHSLGQVEQLCDYCIWINQGSIAEEGIPRDVTRSYMEYESKKQGALISLESAEEVEVEDISSAGDEVRVFDTDTEATGDKTNRWGNGDIVITSVEMLNDVGQKTSSLKVGSSAEICIYYKVVRPVRNASFGVAFFKNDGTHCYGTNTSIDGIDTGFVERDGVYRFCIHSCSLMPGSYTLDVAVSNQNGFDCDYVKGIMEFKTYSPLSDVGDVFVGHEWNFSHL